MNNTLEGKNNYFLTSSKKRKIDLTLIGMCTLANIADTLEEKHYALKETEREELFNKYLSLKLGLNECGLHTYEFDKTVGNVFNKYGRKLK